jgi:hypothetical protein
MPMFPIGSPAAVNISNNTDRDTIGDVYEPGTGGIWRARLQNPLDSPPSRASRGSPSGSEQSGRTGRQGYGYGGRMAHARRKRSVCDL